MLRYSYNNILIIVANVKISEFLSARFVYPGALLPFYLVPFAIYLLPFYLDLQHKNNES